MVQRLLQLDKSDNLSNSENIYFNAIKLSDVELLYASKRNERDIGR